MPGSRVRVPPFPPINQSLGAVRRRSDDRDCGTFAGPQVADHFGCPDQGAEFRGRVVRRDVIRFVAKEELAILEADAGGTQPVSIRVL